MTKSELVEKMVEAHSMLSRKEMELVVNTVFDSMTQALKKGEKVEI
ncbi:MAG TPA: HU family DNA-binding protein, partial [Geobacteraceae bacterium]